PTAVPQVFNFFIEVLANSSTVLQRIPVRIVVPPQLPAYPPSATYWRNYDSTMVCHSNERPDWSQFTWNATTPTGTSIRFEVREATTLAGLATATPVSFTAPGSTAPIDI